MIQRIQTIFLLLSALLMSVFIFLPDFTIGSSLQQELFKPLGNVYLLILSVLTAILPFLNIFLFKNRPIQIKTNAVAVILTLILGGVLFYLYYAGLPATGKTVTLKPFAAIPIVNLVLLFIATYFIRKDENFVKYNDRLR